MKSLVFLPIVMLSLSASAQQPPTNSVFVDSPAPHHLAECGDYVLVQIDAQTFEVHHNGERLFVDRVESGDNTAYQFVDGTVGKAILYSFEFFGEYPRMAYRLNGQLCTEISPVTR